MCDLKRRQDTGMRFFPADARKADAYVAGDITTWVLDYLTFNALQCVFARCLHVRGGDRSLGVYKNKHNNEDLNNHLRLVDGK